MWKKEMQLLNKIGRTEPQCALNCFIGICKHKLNYYMKTMPNIGNL